MIQDIGMHQYSNEFHPTMPMPDGIILSYTGRTILVKKEKDRFIYPRFSDIPEALEKQDEFIWLFTVDEQHYFLARKPLTLAGYDYVPINFMRSAQPRYQAFAGVTGLSLQHWYMLHQYCGHCGKPLQYSQKERMVYCEDCHTMIYPTICPAVIVAVRHGDKLLVSKYAGRDYKRFALLAGFAEIGETIEATVHREVMEEVGIKVKNLQFYKSQPWPFSDSLLFGFFCDLDGSDQLRVDHEELAIAQWIDRHDLPEDNDHTSLTMEMMTQFKNGTW